jgi:hypothetical protein
MRPRATTILPILALGTTMVVYVWDGESRAPRF